MPLEDCIRATCMDLRASSLTALPMSRAFSNQGTPALALLVRVPLRRSTMASMAGTKMCSKRALANNKLSSRDNPWRKNPKHYLPTFHYERVHPHVERRRRPQPRTFDKFESQKKKAKSQKKLKKETKRPKRQQECEDTTHLKSKFSLWCSTVTLGMGIMRPLLLADTHEELFPTLVLDSAYNNKIHHQQQSWWWTALPTSPPTPFFTLRLLKG